MSDDENTCSCTLVLYQSILYLILIGHEPLKCMVCGPLEVFSSQLEVTNGFTLSRAGKKKVNESTLPRGIYKYNH